MTGTNRSLVSALMPYYNGREFVREAVQSILDQTYEIIEIIVIDDASPERKDAEYIRKLTDDLGLTLLRHAKNEGIGRSLADAFEASHGDFITELSQDDLYKPQKIERQIVELTNKKLDAVYAASDVLCQDSGKITVRDTAGAKEIIESGDAAEKLKLQNLSCISIQGLLAKRSVFENDIIPIWRDYLLDDWPVNLRLFEKYRVGFIEEALWTNRSHRKNTSRDIWKWLGPQIEVVARMSPGHLKAEGMGNRIASLARRMLKQNGDREEIVRLAFTGLMLTESPNQHKKAKRVLSKISAKNKRAVTNPKLRLLETVLNPIEKKDVLQKTGEVDWENVGKKITHIVRINSNKERLHEFGKIFALLANNIVLKKQSLNNAVKVALAALMLLDDRKDEENIMKMLRSIAKGKNIELIREKSRILKAQSKPNPKSFFHRGAS